MHVPAGARVCPGPPNVGPRTGGNVTRTIETGSGSNRQATNAAPGDQGGDPEGSLRYPSAAVGSSPASVHVRDQAYTSITVTCLTHLWIFCNG